MFSVYATMETYIDRIILIRKSIFTRAIILNIVVGKRQKIKILSWARGKIYKYCPKKSSKIVVNGFDVFLSEV